MGRLSLVSQPIRTGRRVHLYAADPADAHRLTDWAKDLGLASHAELHADAADAVLRPALMALLAGVKTGDLVCLARAGVLTQAPARGRTRLVTAVKTRAIGLALLMERVGLEQACGGVDAEASRSALDLAAAKAPSHARPRSDRAVRGRSAEAAILGLLHAGRTWSQVQTTLGVTRTQVARCAERLAAVDAAASRCAAREVQTERA